MDKRSKTKTRCRVHARYQGRDHVMEGAPRIEGTVDITYTYLWSVIESLYNSEEARFS